MNPLSMCKECFVDRGYIFLSDYNDFELWQNEHGLIMLIKEIAHTIDKKKIAEIKNLVAQTNFTLFKVVKLFKTTTSPAVLTMLSEDTTINLELKHVNSLICNIMKHECQPRFKKCNDAQSIKQKFTAAIPQMLSSDPVCIWMDWHVGDVIAICDNTKCSSNEDSCCGYTRYRIIV